ncbi:MAG TPA: hypothetical protein VL337_09470, partial [Acidimicrobiales bacterium]|nr:hypothetical protein [Acidimicrobiales bacterium]
AGAPATTVAGAGAGPGGTGRAGGGFAGAGGAGGAGSGQRAGGAGTAAGGAAGGGGPAAGGGAAAAGTVKLIDGANIYVTDGQGNVVKVTTTDSSRFTHTGQGSIADVRPGDTVVVQGQKGADGIVAATAVADAGPAAAG